MCLEFHPGHPRKWSKAVKDQIYFVLSHPNGWEGTQQAEMRKAAVLAKLIPDTKAGHGRLSFVTEGEASLHFSVQNGLPIGVMEDGDGVVIIDAGGGTIDISSYSKNVRAAEARFEEVAAPQGKIYFTWPLFFKFYHLVGHFYGSVFVTVHARLFLESVSCILPDIYGAQCYLDYLQDSTFLANILSLASTKPRNSGFETPMNPSILNLVEQGITNKITISDLANSNSWGRM